MKEETVSITPAAHALKCYVCENSSNCKTEKVCSPSARYCETVTSYNPLNGNLIVKRCSETCFGKNETHQGTITRTTCCHTDLCNSRVANGVVHAAASPSVLVLGTLLGLVCVLLRPGL
ncbi:lymphocyte antigen 6D isoform X2 [Ornithorhynchus anatinus]|uniref:Lymphocyte antigen 6 family member D n=1 Tax=Ornithorhynchus anatinus TaxID=9258 RepID=A0A6I8N2M3_ORNAN|nr:lymphocyte antigen 6D isoform X2 [Ornithorhynchus anatinus]